MSFEPINIYSHRIDPRGVAKLLRAAGTVVDVSGPDDNWSQIVVEFSKKGLFRKARVLTFGHNAEYYDGPNWPRQVEGMQGYFSCFPDSPVKPHVMRLISSFRFSLAVPQHDLNIDGNDERLALVYAVCRHLDGAIFTPSSLRDAEGRILVNSEGYTDPSAVFPKLPSTVDHPEATVDESEDDEDDIEPDPPSAEQVARRTLALTAVSARATLEMDARQIDDADHHRQRLIKWIEEIGISEELEPDEWKVLQRPVGNLDHQAFINAMWRVEGLAVLAWALRLHPMPPYDDLVEPPELYESIGLFDSVRARELLVDPKLRSRQELEEMQKHLLAFHWRMRDFSLRPQPMDFVEFSRNCWFGSFDIKKFQVVDGDLALNQSALSKAPREEIERARSAASERHIAINWLMGFSKVYSETDDST